MMGQKYLHQLLKEDQEPFLLNKYISDRCRQMKRPSLQVKKHKPLRQNSNFPRNLCKKNCLFSFPDATPDLRKSPLLEFAPKSPCKSPNTIFLHIPSRTAALLLEAALRIQKQSKTQKKSNGFGVLGSLFKRLTQNRKREIEGGVRWESSAGNGKSSKVEEKMDFGNAFVCSYNGRPSSAVWSESNEDKSLDMETSSSSSNSNGDDSDEQVGFVTNPNYSPFRFVLQTSPSSPVSSPTRHTTQDKEINGVESINKFRSGEEEEEDKEQCSPVSVLDPPFDDDDERHVNDVEEEVFDMECSYAIVQKAKQQLLYKLSRFEKLAELDPIELEKRMLDQEDDEDDTSMEETDCEASYKENDVRELVSKPLYQTSVHDRMQIPEDLKKLVSDLISEEEREINSLEDREMVTRRVCKRLELWKEVECNTIDMMIEEDLSGDYGGWKKNAEHIKKEMAGEVELAIFGFLVEEFSEELTC